MPGLGGREASNYLSQDNNKKKNLHIFDTVLKKLHLDKIYLYKK